MRRRREFSLLRPIRTPEGETPFGPVAKEHIMTNVTKMLSRMAVVAGVAAVLVSSAVTPSLAFNSNDGGPFYYEPSDNGSVWSYYPGYTTGRTLQHDDAYGARAEVPGFNPGRNVIVDNPPGSAFETRGESHDDVGCPC
jgi:hypothetical protein